MSYALFVLCYFGEMQYNPVFLSNVIFENGAAGFFFESFLLHLLMICLYTLFADVMAYCVKCCIER